MKIKVHLSRFMSLMISLTLLLSQNACLKRVPIPLESKELENREVIYVVLHSGREYKVKHPRFQEEYLIGSLRNRGIKIPLDEIKAIEIKQQDKKKIIMGTLIGAALFIGLGIFLPSPIHVGSVD